MAVVKYQCTNCGDNLIFDADSGLLKCGSCSSTFSIESLEHGKASSRKKTQTRKKPLSSKKKNTSKKSSGDFICPECAMSMQFDEASFQLVCKDCGFKQSLSDYSEPKSKSTHNENTKSDSFDNDDTIDEEKYKCPSCNSDMEYSADSESFVCTNCNNTIEIDNYRSTDDNEKIDEHTSVGTYDEEAVHEYQCENCGAVLVTERNTTATICSFCNSPMILSDRLSGNYAPAQVIPFKMDMKTAHENFKKWCKNGIITPNDFRMVKHIKDIQGVYIPFWLYDLNVKAHGYANCTRIRVIRSGDTETTYTKHYRVYRKVMSDYYKLPADAAEKMPDEYMDKLEPFNYNDLKDFNMGYLTGYGAQKYDYTEKDLLPRITERVTEYISDYLHSTINGYDTVIVGDVNSSVAQKDAVYTLFPLYLLNYNYKGKCYTFAMNGQTGKVVGNPPISMFKLVGLFVAIFGASFGVLKLIGSLLGFL